MNAAPALARQDLPQATAQFIAYGPPVRVGDPLTAGEPVTVRPQTYVRYYPAVKIADIKEGGRSGGDTVAVHLDVESVGLREPITAYLNPDDPVLPYLRSRHSQDAPMAVALETVRRARTRSARTPISPLPPIHALRGAKDPSGAGASMDASLEAVTNKVAMVDGRPSATIVSDPTEWKVLVGNKSGNLPPEGWRYYAPGDDWTQIGTIVPAASAPPADGPAVDVDAFKAVVQEALTQALAGPDHALPERVEAGPGRGRPLGRGRFDEGKKWDARTNDGRINLGSYLVSNVGWVYDWSHEHLTTLHEGAAPPEDAVWALTEQVLTLADVVQADAYGRGVQPDRSAPSHSEATRRVQWVITHRDLPYPYRNAAAEVEIWAKEVATLASGTLARAGHVVGEYFSARTRGAQPRHRTAQAAPTQDTARAQAAPAQAAAPQPPVIPALLDTLTRAWDHAEAIRSLAASAHEAGFAGLPVGVAYARDGRPVFTCPPAAGAAPQVLGELTRARYQTLRATESPARSTPAASASAPVAQPDAAPSEAPSPARPGPAASDGSAPPERGPREPVPAAEPSAGSSGPDPHRGYPAPVRVVLHAAMAARTVEELNAVLLSARGQGVLEHQVWAKLHPAHGVKTAAGQEPGFSRRSLADVLDRRRQHLTSAAGKPVDPPTPSSAAATPPTSTPAGAGQTALFPGKDLVAGPHGKEDPATRAQALADQARKATPADLRSMLDAATRQGLLDTRVTVGGQSGPLHSYLRNRLTAPAQ